jgi:hypothetical protein
MVTFIQNVKDIDADKRQALEHIMGQHLGANQQVVIRVIDVDKEATGQARNEALARAAEIARRGRASAAAQGVSEVEVDAAIDEAIQYVRGQNRNG